MPDETSTGAGRSDRDQVTWSSARPDYRKDHRYVNALAWYKDARAAEGVDYAAAAEYGSRRLSETQETYDLLDKKAEWCFAMCAALVGVLFAVLAKTSIPCWLSAPSFVAFLAAAWLAVRARAPGGWAQLPTTRDALTQVELGRDFAFFQASACHLVKVGLQIVNEWKARQLRLSTILIVLGLALLALPLLAAT